MYYTSIAYKINNKMYIGKTESHSKDISSFEWLSNMGTEGFSEGMLYVVMILECDNNTEIYELDKIPIISLVGDSSFERVEEEDKIMIGNTILSKRRNTTIFH